MTQTKRRTRIYRLHPVVDRYGSDSWVSRDDGTWIRPYRDVLAVSVRQAYYLCARSQWADPNRSAPVGILFDYVPTVIGPDLAEWKALTRCGCAPDVDNASITPKSGVRAIRAALQTVREHERMCPG